ncbi:hypothetical protein ACKXLW_005678, partial [Escherichia coli]
LAIVYNYPEVLQSLPSVHHVPGLRRDMMCHLMMMARDITAYHLNSVHISARRFPGIFQWATGMQTKNLPLTNSLLQNDYAESIFVFNGERDILHYVSLFFI